jgi:hypothetical protein
MTLDRRRFLQVTAAGMVAGVTSSACSRGDREDAQALAQPALLEMLGPERAREIGKQYLAAVPRENSAAALSAAISNSEHRTFPWIGSHSIEDRIRDDFAAGRTVVVGGWVLSQTEARQCALYSLSV